MPTDSLPLTDFVTRPTPAGVSVERLAELVGMGRDAGEGMLFTASPREQLSTIGLWQRVKDLAFFGQLREVLALHDTARHQEFAGDEVALALGTGPTTGRMLLDLALSVRALPGLLEAGEASMLTERHLRAVLRELDLVDLTSEQRSAVVLVLLARLGTQTPGELAALVRRLVLSVDTAAAQLRRDKAVRERHLRTSASADGMAHLHAHTPAEKVAAIKARLAAELDREVLDPDDARTRTQREHDLFVDLLTRGVLDDQPAPSYAVQVVVPFSTAEDGDLELAEIPGYGPILPGTARDLMDDAASLSQVAVDEDGTVFAVGDPVPGPRAAYDGTLPDATCAADEDEPGCADPVLEDEEHGPEPVAQRVDALRRALSSMSAPPLPRTLATRLGRGGYRPGARTAALVKARDRTCTFPGCHRRVADLDHRVPWPLGPTHPDNLHLLCRHHHRAKQAVFRVQLDDEGNTLWITRGSWTFLRERQAH